MSEGEGEEFKGSGTLENINMLDKIKRLTNTENKRRLLSNFMSLSVLQGANYVLPLITLPYLVRVLGPEKYGLIAFAQAFIQYFNILTDYGFNLSATREISIHRNNAQRVSEIFSSVMIIKLGLLVLSFVIMSILVFSFWKFRQDWLIYYLTFGMVVGQVLFPVWFFQGMERMKYITFLNITAKLIFTIAIFVFIRQASDYIYVPLLNLFGYWVAGALALWIVFRDFKIGFKVPSYSSLIHQLKEGSIMFVSTVAISLYTTSNVFLLGLFTNNVIVGFYSAAEKIVKALQGLWTPFSQAIYPIFSKLYYENRTKAQYMLKKILLYTGLITLAISLTGCIFAPFIIKVFFGEAFTPSVNIMQILVFIVFLIGINNVLGIQGLVAFGFAKEFTLTVIIASITHLILLIIFIPVFKGVGVAIATIVTETIIIFIEIIFLKRRKII